MKMDKLKRFMFWLAVAPALITFWSFVSTAVYFIDDVQYIRSVVTKDAVKNFNGDIAIIKNRLRILERK